MKGEWCYFKSYFSKEYCNSILEKSKDLNFKKANLGEDGLTTIDGYRKSDVTWLLPQDFSDLYDEIWKLEREANNKWFGFHIDNLEYIQLAKYEGDVQGEYKRHKDVFWVNNSERHRKLSAVIQLSDPNDYEGGDLQIWGGGQEPISVKRNKGDVSVFPAFLLHRVTPITRGQRKILVFWTGGRAFR